MPVTLAVAARNSPANLVSATNHELNIKNSTTTKPTTAKTTASTIKSTCTYPTSNNNSYLQREQLYEETLKPPATLSATVADSLTSFPTFNGNSIINMANGNITGNNNNNNNGNSNNNNKKNISNNSSNGNGNGNANGSNKLTANVDNSLKNAAQLDANESMQSSNSTAATATEMTTTSSSLSTASTVTIGSGGGVVGPVSIIKKTTTSLQQQQQFQASSHDDGTSSVNSQFSNSNNNNNYNGLPHMGNHNYNATKNNANNNPKGSKDDLNSNLYNGNGSGSAGSIEGGSINGGGAGGSISSRNTEVDDPGDGLGPLPPKWETAYTERGELYFIDHNTGTSHWLDPRLSKYQKKSLEDCGDDELPYGWEKIEDALYGTYYIDHVNRRTQYENPVLEAKRRAAEQNQQKQMQQQQQQNQEPPQRSHTPTMRNSPSILSIGKLNASNISPTKLLERRPPHPPPPLADLNESKSTPTALNPYKFTRNPAEMQGERITTTLVKSKRGLGLKIVGGDDGIEEFLQIKSIVPNGPAWQDGQLQSGDVLVYVNDLCVLGFSHHEMINVFQSILPGDNVTLEVCRGYPMAYDPNDPNTEIVTTIAVENSPEKQRRLLMDLNLDGNYNFQPSNEQLNSAGTNIQHQMYHSKSTDGFILMKKPEVHTITILKGAMGFGFTIADAGFGQKVKKILDRNCCTHLQEGDILLEINNVSVRGKTHLEVVQMLKDCSKSEPTVVKIQRANFGGGGGSSNAIANRTTSPNTSNSVGNVAKLRKTFIGNTATGLFRSKTPTADIYSTQPKEILPMRPKTPLVDTRRTRVKTPNNELNDAEVAAVTGGGGGVHAGVHGLMGDAQRSLVESKSQVDGKSTNSLQEIDVLNQDIPFMDPYPKLVTSLSERLADVGLRDGANSSRLGYHAPLRPNYENQEYVTASNHSGSYNPIYGLTTMPPPLQLNALQLNRNEANTATQLPTQLYTTPSNASSYQQQYPHGDACNCYDCQDYRGVSKVRQQPFYGYQKQTTHAAYPNGQYSPGSLQAAHIQNERKQKRVNDLLNDRRRVGFSPLEAQMLAATAPTTAATLPTNYLHHHQQQQQQQRQQQHSPAVSSISQQQQQYLQQQQPWLNSNMNTFGSHTRNPLPLDVSDETEQYELSEVTLERQALGFGFRIVGGTEEGSQVTVGHVVPGGAADNDHRINVGDEILSIDGVNVVNSSHHKVVSLMGEAALRGQVSMILRRRLNPRPFHDKMLTIPGMHTNFEANQQTQTLPLHAGLPGYLKHYPYDVIVSRQENEGFGFVIISSSNQYYGSTIGKLIPGSPADRCGELKVGDRIIAVNRIEIAGMSHGDVVNLIKESGLHVRLTIGSPSELTQLNMQASPGQHSQAISLHGGIGAADMQSTSSSAGLYFERPGTQLSGIGSIASMSPNQAQQLQQQQQQQLQQTQQQSQLRL